MRVRVSSASARQLFHGCEPGYIRDVCKAACCRSSTAPTGTRIALLPAEAERERARGLVVLAGELQPRPGERRCPHQGPEGLCGLHGGPDKPFGCIASPFVLTSRDTLVVRNRYRLLRCYRDGDLPAYRAFGASLVLLLGEAGAAELTRHLDEGGDDLEVEVPEEQYRALRTLSDHGGGGSRGSDLNRTPSGLDSRRLHQPRGEDVMTEPEPTTDAAPAWARGYPLAELRAVADLYRDDPYALGAFSQVKERDIAGWRAEDALFVVGRKPVAAGYGRVSKTGVAVRDFTGVPVTAIPRGSYVLSYPGARSEAGWTALAKHLVGPRLPRLRFLEGWAESADIRDLAAAAGMDLLATKIRASSELVGIWGPRGWSHDEVSDADEVALGRLGVELPADLLLDAADEAESLDLNAWAQHYSSYNARHAWTALALQGYTLPGEAQDPLAIQKPAEMSKAWKQEHPGWEAADVAPLRLVVESLPAVAQLVQALGAALGKDPRNPWGAGMQRVRLMRLEPGGGELTRHADIVDPESGTADGKEARIHVPLVSNPEVRFTQWRLNGAQEEAVMRPGEVWYLDTRKPHKAGNYGQSPRIHLVVDVYADDRLRELIAGSSRGQLVR